MKFGPGSVTLNPSTGGPYETDRHQQLPCVRRALAVRGRSADDEAASPQHTETLLSSKQAAGIGDSPLVRAAKASNRLDKKPGQVITNETLVRAGGHFTTTTAAAQTPLPAPPAAAAAALPPWTRWQPSSARRERRRPPPRPCRKTAGAKESCRGASGRADRRRYAGSVCTTIRLRSKARSPPSSR